MTSTIRGSGGRVADFRGWCLDVNSGMFFRAPLSLIIHTYFEAWQRIKGTPPSRPPVIRKGPLCEVIQ